MATHSAHDRLFEFTFRHARHAAGWLRSVLPKRLADAIDWSRLTPLRDRFPGTRLRPHVADGGFAAPFHATEQSFEVVFVTEHKSFDDPDLFQQVLRYSIHLQRSLRSGPGRYPPVLAIVLRHGRRRAKRPQPPVPAPLAELMTGQPRQQLYVDDLDETDEQAIAARGLTPLAELTLLCLRSLPTAQPADLLLPRVVAWRADSGECSRR